MVIHMLNQKVRKMCEPTPSYALCLCHSLRERRTNLLFGEGHAYAQSVVVLKQGVEQLEGTLAAGGADGLENLEQPVGLEDDVDVTGVTDDVCLGLDDAEGECQFLGGGVVAVGAVEAALSDGECAGLVFVERDGAGAFLHAHLGQIGIDLAGDLLGYCIAAEGGQCIVALEDEGTALEVPGAYELLLADGGEGVEH